MVSQERDSADQVKVEIAMRASTSFRTVAPSPAAALSVAR
jgi:hypothetical protein